MAHWYAAWLSDYWSYIWTSCMKIQVFFSHLYWVQNNDDNNKILKATALITTQTKNTQPTSPHKTLCGESCRNVCMYKFVICNDTMFFFFMNGLCTKAASLINKMGRICLTKELLRVPSPCIARWTVLITVCSYLGHFSDSTQTPSSPRCLYTSPLTFTTASQTLHM